MLLKYSGHSQINVNNSIGVTLNSSLPKKNINIKKALFSLFSLIHTYLSQKSGFLRVSVSCVVCFTGSTETMQY